MSSIDYKEEIENRKEFVSGYLACKGIFVGVTTCILSNGFSEAKNALNGLIFKKDFVDIKDLINACDELCEQLS